MPLFCASAASLRAKEPGAEISDRNFRAGLFEYQFYTKYFSRSAARSGAPTPSACSKNASTEP